MSKYTTGEIAKLCDVSVRTVQYYDSCNLLVPSEVSEGGRRLYSQEDVKRLKLICYLRNLDISIKDIQRLFQEEYTDKILDTLLQEQQHSLQNGITKMQMQLHQIEELQNEIKHIKNYTVDTISDITKIMENNKKHKHMLYSMLALGLIMEGVELTIWVYAFKTEIWWPLFPGFLILTLIGMIICHFYYQRTIFICPHCHTTFKPKFKEFFFANHTSKLRKLTCSHCLEKSFCIETYGRKEDLC